MQRCNEKPRAAAVRVAPLASARRRAGVGQR